MWLASQPTAVLLARVGDTIEEIPEPRAIDKQVLPASYGGGSAEPTDDFLVGQGLFYLTEQRRLMLDCTSGHYQMPWGYSHRELCDAAAEAMLEGVVWDNHSNIPQTPVKRLARRLLEVVNKPEDRDPIDKCLIGVATGTSAAAAALKMQLAKYMRDRRDAGTPAVIVIDGNYHGTDMFTQYLRGMWTEFVTNLEVVAVQPNDIAELQTAFNRCGKRVAGFWCEPVMMNREAILVEPAYLKRARELCSDVGAAMCIDEIQTGFWQPTVLSSRAFDFTPDMVVVGKGMTAGFHPLSALLFRSEYDILAQYDALNTNGGAALASYIGLCCLDMVEGASDQISLLGERIMEGLRSLASEFGDILEGVRGQRYLAGLKFRDREQALAFHKQAVAAGLWIRAHAYHPGHSTVLTKLGLLADESVIDFMTARLRGLLAEMRG